MASMYRKVGTALITLLVNVGIPPLPHCGGGELVSPLRGGGIYPM